MDMNIDLIKNFMQEEDGVTAIEYGLLAALIAVALIAGAKLLGTNLDGLFKAIAAKLPQTIA